MMKLRPLSAKSFMFASIGVLCLTLAPVLSVVLLRFDHNEVLTQRSARGLIEHADRGAQQFAQTGETVNAYVTPAMLRDAYNDWQISLGSGQVVANTYKKFGDALTDYIKKDAGPATERIVSSVEQRLLTVDRTIGHFDERAFGDAGLLPQATRAVVTFNTNLISLNDLEQAARIAVEKFGMPLDQLNKILADRNIPLIISQLANGTLQFEQFTTALKVDAEHMQQAIDNFSELLD